MKKNIRTILGMAIAAPALCACEPASDNQRLVGQLESDRIEITAEFAEPIIERAVVEGEQVEFGQLLIRQDTSRIDARMTEAQATLEQSRARQDELIRGPRREQIIALQASVDGAGKELEFRETDLQRARDLLERKLGSTELRDRARAARDAAQANLASLEAKLDELQSGTTTEELQQVQAAVAQAEARLKSLQIDHDRHSAYAPTSGVVDTLLFEAGERPGIGQPMAIVLAGDQSYARIYVPEALRVRVSPGISAWVYIDGLDARVEGSVRWVSSDAAFTPYFALTKDDRGRLSYAAKIDIAGTSVRFPDGVPVEVQLLLDRDDN